MLNTVSYNIKQLQNLFFNVLMSSLFTLACSHLLLLLLLLPFIGILVLLEHKMHHTSGQKLYKIHYLCSYWLADILIHSCYAFAAAN